MEVGDKNRCLFPEWQYSHSRPLIKVGTQREEREFVHTVKRAHIRSIFSGFLGPPFLFSLTRNRSLKCRKERDRKCNELHILKQIKKAYAEKSLKVYKTAYCDRQGLKPHALVKYLTCCAKQFAMHICCCLLISCDCVSSLSQVVSSLKVAMSLYSSIGLLEVGV